MTENVERVVGPPKDPALRALAERVAREFELAADKVAANASRPAAFPMPEERDSTEQILAKRFRALPAATRTAAASAAAHRIAAPPAARARQLSALAGVELAKPTPIEKQVAALSRAAAPTLTRARLLAEAGQAAPAVAGRTPMTKLELRLHNVRCGDETGRFDFGSDEIDLGAVSVDESGDTHPVTPFRVASFDQGDVKTYNPPRRLTFFNLGEGTDWPKGYVVALTLAEIDSGGFNEFVRMLAEKVRERVVAALAAAIGGLIGASGGPIGVVIGIAVGYVVGLIFDWLSNVWKDDVFTPVRVSTTISSPTGRWDGKDRSPQRTVTFSGHRGRYTVTYDWRLFTGPA